MKKSKHIFILILASLLLLSGCGGQTAETEADTTPAVQTETEEETIPCMPMTPAFPIPSRTSGWKG